MSCGSLTFAVGVVAPTPEEARWGAGNVESYKCQNCGRATRFPRYNHPAKLLGKIPVRGDFFNLLTANRITIGHFRLVVNLGLKARLSAKIFILSLAFIMRFKATRKWPIPRF